MRTLTNKLLTLAVLAGLLLALPLAAADLRDAAGHWYDPDHSGHGLHIDYNAPTGQAAVTWYLYRPDGSSAFLQSVDNCQDLPCEVALAEHAGAWMGGRFGGPERSMEVVGVLEIEPAADDRLRAKWDLVEWADDPGDLCDTLSGGLILRGCVGTVHLARLTRPF